jgi:hypothetical protein
MKYSAFEEAAVEASIGLREIDAEIEQLTAKRKMLGVLVQQLSAVLPLCAEENSADEANHAVATAADLSSGANGLPEDSSYSLRKNGWSPQPPAAAAADAPAAEQFSAAKNLPEAKAALADGWPTHSQAATAVAAPAAEQSSFANTVSEGKSHSLRTEGWPSSSATEQRGIRELL